MNCSRIGLSAITTGNHAWDKKEILDYFPRERRLLRPANYPEGVPGQGSVVIQTKSGEELAVLQLMGRAYMPTLDCPFQVAKREMARLRKLVAAVLVDMHAEATSEKMAMGHYLDGEATAVVGTHTHVQTADEQILPRGTAYLTDIGMTGPLHGVIGVQERACHRKISDGHAAALRGCGRPHGILRCLNRVGRPNRQGAVNRADPIH